MAVNRSRPALGVAQPEPLDGRRRRRAVGLRAIRPSAERRGAVEPRRWRRRPDGQRQQLLAGRADLDVGAHLRADAAVEARRPAAVLDLDLVERVLPVLPEPVLVQAGVEVVPGQHLVVASRSRVVYQSTSTGWSASAVVGARPSSARSEKCSLQPSKRPPSSPDRADDRADPAVAAGEQALDDAGLAVVVAEADRAAVLLVAADRVAQLLQPGVGRPRRRAAAAHWNGVCGLGTKPPMRHRAADVAAGR